MMGIVVGLVIVGKIFYMGIFVNFFIGWVYDQICQLIVYFYKNVKVCVLYVGLILGEDGVIYQILEDMGMMCMLFGFIVINFCDYN